MRYLICFTILSLFTLIGVGGCQTELPKSKAQHHDVVKNITKATIENSNVERFHSKYIGDYKITTYWPSEPAPKEGWPVIYLLDGDSYFFTVNNILTTQVCNRCVIQDGIVVAIDYFGHSRRSLDYLPKPKELKLEILPNGKINIPEAYGGADNFWQFLEHELKPAMEKRFTINTARQTVFGHSYGALWVLHALLTKPTTFNTYIASSPSMWFSDGYMFTEVATFLANKPKFSSPINLLLSVGGAEQSLTAFEKTLPLEKQKLLLQHRLNRKMVGSATDLFKELASAKVANLNVNFEVYPNQTHKTVQFVALQDGIQVGFANLAQVK
ncbi:alpha/beta hydrolase-fold protein [Orbaceae bacterium ESL0721]|nr:alpha/beta hydrolase-fold protein [Orbaceae bacterium ESL0721]